MNVEEFRRYGKEMIDYVADYLETIRERRPFPEVMSGYLQRLVPDHAPEEGESWDSVFKDIERVIMPGVTHWQSPHFHAYYPTASSYPAIVADILSNGIGCIGFSWASSPACTELEIAMMDWLGKMIDLPEQFLACSGPGAGVIQGSASEASLVTILAARSWETINYKKTHPGSVDGEIMSRFVAYCSDQAHSALERGGLMAGIRTRALPTDNNSSLRGKTLRNAIQQDRADGLIPVYVCATLGTTYSCAFDNLVEIGEICKEQNIWLHVDAAYAGSSFICPEFRPLLNGIEFATSFNFNPHKWMRVNFDCSALWVKDKKLLEDSFHLESLILDNRLKGTMPDYRHWQIPLGRRFRSLKIWFVVRMYGVKALREYIRNDVQMAHQFEDLVRADDRFEIVQKVVLGLVCFRLKKTNEVNKRLLELINEDGWIHMTPSEVKGVYFLRFTICSSRTEPRDIVYAWTVIQELTQKLLETHG